MHGLLSVLILVASFIAQEAQRPAVVERGHSCRTNIARHPSVAQHSRIGRAVLHCSSVTWQGHGTLTCRHHPGASTKGEEEAAEAESQHVHVVTVAFLQLVFPSIDQAHRDVLIKEHDNKTKKASDHCEANASTVDVSQVHEPRAYVGAEGGGSRTACSQGKEIQVDLVLTVMTNEGPVISTHTQSQVVTS